MDHSTSILGVASSIAHELGHSLGLDHDSPGSRCPCPGPAPAKTCIMEASTDFLPGLNFSNCSRRALEQALLAGLGGCLLERSPSLPVMAAFCGNMFVDPGEQCDCGFPDDCTDTCCDAFTCQLRPGAQCASDGPCCQKCQLRPAGWQCRPPRGDCDLPEVCSGDSSQCPLIPAWETASPVPAARLCVCTGAVPLMPSSASRSGGPEPSLPSRFASAQPTRGGCVWELRAQPGWQLRALHPERRHLWAAPVPGGGARPLLGLARERLWEMVEANGTQLNCSWVHLDLGSDVAQPLLTLPGTACGPGMVCVDRRCQPEALLGAQECRSSCHGHGSATATSAATVRTAGHPRLHRPGPSEQLPDHWAAPQPPAAPGPAAAWCQLLAPGPPAPATLPAQGTQLPIQGGPICPPERPGPPRRALLVPGAKSQGPAKPPPPRKPLPADPQGRRPSGDPPGPGAGIPPPVIPSRPAPPPPAVSSLYL